MASRITTSRRAKSRAVGSAPAPTQLGLAGDVDDDAFRAVLAGEDPSAGVRLRRGNARLCAFDLTLSAPKSVSLLWALGDPDTAHAVVAAHEHAVDQTIGYLEREAVRIAARARRPRDHRGWRVDRRRVSAPHEPGR